ARVMALWDHRIAGHVWKMAASGQAAVGTESILLVDGSPASAKCVDLTGKLRWEWQDEQQRIGLVAARAAADVQSRTWLVLAEARNTPDTDEIIRIRDDREVLQRIKLGHRCWESAFFADGRHFVTNLG